MDSLRLSVVIDNVEDVRQVRLAAHFFVVVELVLDLQKPMVLNVLHSHEEQLPLRAHAPRSVSPFASLFHVEGLSVCVENDEAIRRNANSVARAVVLRKASVIPSHPKNQNLVVAPGLEGMTTVLFVVELGSVLKMILSQFDLLPSHVRVPGLEKCLRIKSLDVDKFKRLIIEAKHYIEPSAFLHDAGE